MILRMLSNCSFAVGLGLLVSRWNVQSGLAIGIACVIVAIIVAQYQIGPKRLLALALVAIIGKAIPPVADAVIKATDSEQVDESEDWIMNWIVNAWKVSPPKFSESLAIVLVVVVTCSVLAVSEYFISKAGNMGMLLPFENLNASLYAQAWGLGAVTSVVISSVLLSVYSIPLRRVLVVSVIIGFCFGSIVGLSVADWMRGSVSFSVLAVGATIIFLMLVMWVERQENKSKPDN